MKIAIQGHLSRGKEVIQILKSLGGKSREEFTGNRWNQYYFINYNGDIDLNLKINLLNYKFYTLEEFEKEFPFKVGDMVTHPLYNNPFTIIELNPTSEFPYVIQNEEAEFNAKSKILTEYKKKKTMEIRTINLSLNKAKEWYKKGGELREIALQAFTEIELNPLPRSWEEFCKNYPMKSGMSYIDDGSNIKVMSSCDNNDFRHKNEDKNLCPSQKSAEAHLAMIQLEQLRNCWWNGWKPEWNNCQKHVIKWEGNNLTVFTAARIHAFLVFPTREMAEEFLECFRDLIEKAGDLI